jgi:multiple sugar transport system permease protein
MARELTEVEFVANPIQRLIARVRVSGGRFVFRLILFALLIDLGFVYFLPLAFMLFTSFKSPLDLANPTVHWLPTRLFWPNYQYAWQQLNYGPSLLRTILFVVLACVGQVASTALAGYGFARYTKIRGVEIIFLLAVFTFIVPPQTVIVSMLLNFKLLGWINTYRPLVIPEWFAQGLRAGFFIFIFRQAFRALPFEYEEAARVDGANALQVFYRVMLPLVQPSIAVALVFSVVWHWNETYLIQNVIPQNPEKWTLSVELLNFTNSAMSSQNSLNSNQGFQQRTLLSANDAGAIMAGAMLVILPPVIFYIIIQRTFVQGVQRAGLIE